MPYVQWIRSLVGRRKIFLVFATVIVIDDKGRILLQHRTDFNLWGLPGGVLELEEDILSCARRELAEETGLEAGKLGLVGLYTDPRFDVVYPNGDEVQQFTICFTCNRTGGKMRADGIETSKQGFFDLSEIAGMDVPDWYRAMIRDAVQGGPPAFSAPSSVEKRSSQFDGIRPEAGAGPVIAVAASAAVRRGDGRLLAVRTGAGDRWKLPGGYCDIGENAAYTAQRHTLIQTGLRIIPDSLMAIYSTSEIDRSRPQEMGVQMVTALFRCRVVEGELVRDGRGRQADWLSQKELVARASDRHRAVLSTALLYLDDGCFVM